MGKQFIYILILIFIFSCKPDEHLEVVEEHDNGMKKIVHKYPGS